VLRIVATLAGTVVVQVLVAILAFAGHVLAGIEIHVPDQGWATLVYLAGTVAAGAVVGRRL
jgi:hypothetical protein